MTTTTPAATNASPAPAPSSAPVTPDQGWLRRYYTVRALFSAGWVALALTVGARHPAIGIALALAYPAWDALANGYDARRSGGIAASPTQALNMAISAAVTLAVAAAVAVTATTGLHAVVGIIGGWAILAGLLQLATAARRRSSAAAQWPMILSGAQSAAAGLHFILRALDPARALTVADIAPYAAFGALYFAISAAVLALRRRG